MALNALTVSAPTGMRLTGEQDAIMSAYDGGSTLVVEALAGTGKTTTLKALAAAKPRRPGIYLAFNKSIVLEARGKFPDAVEVTTAHSLAYRAVGYRYANRLPGNGTPRISAQRMATMMKLRATHLNSGAMLNPALLVRLAQATVTKYSKSADEQIAAHHMPSHAAHLGHDMNELADIVLPIANRIWADLREPTGRFYFTHDHYLKLWQLTRPRLAADYIMFDEAQDADPVIASIVGAQDAQRIYVGDQNQAIYGWRGAVNAMGRVQDAIRLPLTKSFRFGPAIAEAANGWLDLLGSNLRVVGHDPITSTVGPLDAARAILCRTNGTALGWVLAFQERGVPVALAPGDRNAGKDISAFAWAAKSLMNGEGTDHPDLASFTTWAELVKFVDEEEDAADLKRLVGIINRIGPSGVIDAIKRLVTEDRAQVTVSTAHKAKGLEWDSVKVADDFTPPDPDDEKDRVEPADLMLAYVTVTRAKRQLDPGSLADPLQWKP